MHKNWSGSVRHLNKRIFRSLKAQWSKNLFLFILMFSMISITSGMLVSSGSIKVLYYDLMSKGIVEDGKILFAFNPTEEIIKSIEETNVKTEKSPYIDAQIKEVKNVVTIIRELIPSNPIKAMVDFNVIGVVIFAMFVGLAARYIQNKDENKVKTFIDYIGNLLV